MLVYRSTVAGAIAVGALLVGCAAPDQPTDLRKDGPPSVTSVVVMTDLSTDADPPAQSTGASRLIETATYCRIGDEKRPGIVGLPNITTTQVCPDDLTKAAVTDKTAEGVPPAWYLRVVFDELLNPDVEELLPIDPALPDGPKYGTLINTQPVGLKCEGVDIDYDGYYAPNGNKVSWPLGPHLFILPLDPGAAKTGSTCEVTLGAMVTNKRGEKVANGASFTFKIAPMELRFSEPDYTADDAADGSLEQATDTPVEFFFTGAIGSLPAAADVRIFSGANGAGSTPNAAVCGAGGTQVAAVSAIAGDEVDVDLIMLLGVTTGTAGEFWLPDTTYRVEFAPTAKVTAKQGSVGVDEGKFPSDFKLCFHTLPATP